MARQLTFTSKETSLEGQVSVITASVTALDNYSEESVTQVMRLLDIEGVNRVLVVNSDRETLYEPYENGADPDGPEGRAVRALRGRKKR